MTIRSHNWHVTPVGSELKRILRNTRTASAHCTPILDDGFGTQLARVVRINGLWWDNVDVMLEQAVNDHAEDETLDDGIGKEETMPEYKWSSL